ncbi:ADP-forming succinate--CoA ligase subunit beta [Halochromatium salexigens]|uniref:Succinate--CoA ligase [ADP-forming] subunit beta n=1 Tax=Halochromatium salexigens TaxID=49447 RepID=A0AAJ0XGB5_HALSE|nr:ADP-forming succinate--CoA ligase subunit beta [Halochromatium salexigens]MBK5930615.1 succinate--CoA ligase subunit beta [Halochromatium salexigens]
MNLHEYQAKKLFTRFAIPVPESLVASSPDEARAAAQTLGMPVLVKAQVHAGGRGRAGGVQRCESVAELETQASALLGSRLVTSQTPPAGLPVSQLLLEAPVVIARELYLALLVDREAECIAIMASAAGGMDIEAVAATQPEAVLVSRIEPAVGLRPWQCRQVGLFLGLTAQQQRAFEGLLSGLYQLLTSCDARLVEINPLVVTEDGELIALDAKLDLDDSALYRHLELAALHDPSQEDAREIAARAEGLSYISLDGDIGCMVNGAGLAMATMDLIALHGGAPANFLDVGGSATADRVARAFALVLSDDKVAAVLVNIFGGIVRCDLIAEGILAAVEEVGVEVPVVVRLEGTNAALGLERLAHSGLAIETAATLVDAANKVVAAAAGQGATIQHAGGEA